MDDHIELIAGTDTAHQLALRDQTPDVLTALENQLQFLLSLVTAQQAKRSAS